MFNRSQILRKAWASYRTTRPAFCVAGDTADKRMLLRDLFAKMLRLAWAEAKRARSIETTAAAFVEAERRAQTARAVAMSPVDRATRIVEIRSELRRLEYAPLGVRTSHRRHDLGAELSILTQASA